ncbi:MAG: hypothetical protein ABEJ02_04565 [Candidatus Paceibacteria bacterium]
MAGWRKGLMAVLAASTLGVSSPKDISSGTNLSNGSSSVEEKVQEDMSNTKVSVVSYNSDEDSFNEAVKASYFVKSGQKRNDLFLYRSFDNDGDNFRESTTIQVMPAAFNKKGEYLYPLNFFVTESFKFSGEGAFPLDYRVDIKTIGENSEEKDAEERYGLDSSGFRDFIADFYDSGRKLSRIYAGNAEGLASLSERPDFSDEGSKMAFENVALSYTLLHSQIKGAG